LFAEPFSRQQSAGGFVYGMANERRVGGMETVETDNERARVEGWRLHVLMEAGFPLPLAERIAGNETVDLHRAVELVASGCTPETAAEILL